MKSTYLWMGTQVGIRRLQYPSKISNMNAHHFSVNLQWHSHLAITRGTPRLSPSFFHVYYSSPIFLSFYGGLMTYSTPIRVLLSNLARCLNIGGIGGLVEISERYPFNKKIKKDRIVRSFL